MNRWLAILILSFGTAILVTHAALPHHHHEGVVCYHQDACDSHAGEASHCDGPPHPIDYHCVLKQLYVAPIGKKQLFVNDKTTSREAFSSCTLMSQPVEPPCPVAFPLKFLPSHRHASLYGPVTRLTSPRAPPSI